jgi:hypothetical protein
MKFEREFEVAVLAPEVWKAMWDIDRMVTCVPGCTRATVIEEKRRYQATIVEKVGPFKVQVLLDIEILNAEPGHSLQLRATGKDTRIGTEVSFVLLASIEPRGQHTQCIMSVDATVVGRLVSLGMAVIKLKGNQQMDKFVAALQINFAGNVVA